MKLPSLKKLSKTSWYLLISSTLIALVWGAVIIPGLNRLQANTQELLDTRAAQLTDSDVTSNLISAVQHQTELTENTTALQQLFIPKKNPLAFINRLEELAEDAGVIIEINVQEPESKQANLAIITTSLTITVTGDYPAVLQFVEAMLHEPTIIQVQTVDLSTPSSEAGVVSLDLSALTYWQ